MKCTNPNCHCGPAGCPWWNGELRRNLDEYAYGALLQQNPRPIRSGDRIATGTGATRRRLTQAEAEAGALPEPFTKAEWEAMATASRVSPLRNPSEVRAFYG